MRHSKATIKEASALIAAMKKAKVPAFADDVFGLAERAHVEDMISRAKHHHTIQERWCSEDMDDDTRTRLEKKEIGLEQEIRATAMMFSLKVHFDGDPRGFTVKLHAPSGDVFNTWGGRESGYGIGDKAGGNE